MDIEAAQIIADAIIKWCSILCICISFSALGIIFSIHSKK